MPTVIVDGTEVTIGDKERLNGIQVAARIGIDVPHYCWHAGLSVVASCRMCLVETGKRDSNTGQIAMLPKVVPACQTPATDGTVFITNSQKVKDAREMIEEDLLLRHPVDCSICDKAGECRLQDYHFLHGRDQRRADIKPFHSRRRSLGDTVTLFVDRCVMCSRCVRFCREVTGTSELMITNRGAHEEIDIFPGIPLSNKLSGNVVDLCPVGALGDKDFLYSQRVWFMKSHDHVCGNCATGCSIKVDENQNQIYRLKPRENPAVNKWWICDEGRYGWKHVHDPNRNVNPSVREAGALTMLEWPHLIPKLEAALKKAGRLAGVVSPHLTVEEAYLFCKYLRSIDPNGVLAIGPIPIDGEDESFPGGFTIRAEKCPNRRGVEKVVGRFAGQLLDWPAFLDGLKSQSLDGVWITGGYHSEWIDEKTASQFADVPLLIVQDLFPSPVWNRAHFQLPGAAYPEREGSFVNRNDRLQSFEWAIRPPAGVMVEGRLYWQLLNMPGQFDSRRVLYDVARDNGYFAVAGNPIPETGVDLKLNQIASPV